MRVAIFLAALSIGVLNTQTPAFAQSTQTQVKDAVDVYFGGKRSIEDYLNHYRDTILDGAEGTWLQLPPDSDIDIPDFLEDACARIGLKLARVSPYAFTMTRNAGARTPVRYTYVSMGGGTFSVQVDAEQLFAWLFPGGDVPPDMTKQALYLASGIATLYRPSPDVLVVHQNFSVPNLYVRCP